jgi:uncharacterized protein YbjT (DUF2867 family)
MGMHIVIIGANGKIGRQLIQLLAGTEHRVRAMIRKEEQAPELKRLGADEIVVADLEKDFDHALQGCSAVVFTAGSGSHTGPDKTELVDRLGAIRSIEKAEALGIDRFIMVSSMYADRPEDGPERIRHYFRAKGAADDRLRDSKLNYTIIRPGRLTNDPPAFFFMSDISVKSFAFFTSSYVRVDCGSLWICGVFVYKDDADGGEQQPHAPNDTLSGDFCDFISYTKLLIKYCKLIM